MCLMEKKVTKTIILNDGLKVEVEVSENEAHEISDGLVVDSSIDNLKNLLSKVMHPVSNVSKELNKDMKIDSTKISVGVKIDIEGNFILAKSNVGANIQVEMVVRPTNA